MDRNVFYYETDAKGDPAVEFLDGGSTISESILQVLKNELTLEMKQRRLLALFEKISLEKKELEGRLEELQSRNEQLTLQNQQLTIANTRLEQTPASSPPAPVKKPVRPTTPNHPSSFMVNSLLSSPASVANKGAVSAKLAAAKPKSVRGVSELRHNSSVVSIKSKNDPPTTQSTRVIPNDLDSKELRKYKNFVESILKVRTQLIEAKEAAKPFSASNLQAVWSWLKAHFEQFIDLRSALSKNKKKTLTLTLFRENVRKLLETETDEDTIDHIRNLIKNNKQMLAIIEKCRKSLQFKGKEKGDKGLAEFERFLSK